MKKILLGAGILLTSLAANAQIEITLAGQTADVSGTIISVTVDADSEFYEEFDVDNVSGATLTGLSVQRIKIAEVLGGKDNICWGVDPLNGACYPEFAVAPNDPWTNPDGDDADLLDATGGWLKAAYRPYGTSGMTHYRYYILDDSDVALDSVDIQFNSVLSIAEAPVAEIGVYPNPASSDVNVALSNAEQGTIVVFDALGKEVLRSKVVNNSSVNVSELRNGVYFYNFVGQNGNATKAKRLIVKK